MLRCRGKELCWGRVSIVLVMSEYTRGVVVVGIIPGGGGLRWCSVEVH